jgi:predicted RNase H-like nuclease (RuvC/YqgF family)
MKEQREMQTMIDQLEKIIIEQDNEMEKLERDAARYRWLRKYTGQMFMATEQQVDAEVDRAMAGGVK